MKLAMRSALSTLALFSSQVFAVPMFHMITESDPGGANNTLLTSYNSLADLSTLTANGPTIGLPGPSSGVSIRALAYDGFQFHMISESDPGGANNTLLTSYNSLADLMTLTANGPTVGLPGPSSGVSIRALVYDGFQFHMIFESDPGGANNSLLTSYNSLDDLKTLTANGPAIDLPGPSSGVSISALAFDGFLYHLITESDPGGANNALLTSYNLLDDLKTLTANGPAIVLPGPSSGVSISALVFVPDPASQIPEPGTIWLVAMASMALLPMLARRRRGC